jgi:hypothetical protein
MYKRIIAFFLLIGSILALSGCGNQTEKYTDGTVGLEKYSRVK